MAARFHDDRGLSPGGSAAEWRRGSIDEVDFDKRERLPTG